MDAPSARRNRWLTEGVTPETAKDFSPTRVIKQTSPKGGGWRVDFVGSVIRGKGGADQCLPRMEPIRAKNSQPLRRRSRVWGQIGETKFIVCASTYTCMGTNRATGLLMLRAGFARGLVHKGQDESVAQQLVPIICAQRGQWRAFAHPRG